MIFGSRRSLSNARPATSLSGWAKTFEDTSGFTLEKNLSSKYLK